MHKAWCSIEEVPYYFSRLSIKFQGHMGWKWTIWFRFEWLLGQLQLSNSSDLPCYLSEHGGLVSSSFFQCFGSSCGCHRSKQRKYKVSPNFPLSFRPCYNGIAELLLWRQTRRVWELLLKLCYSLPITRKTLNYAVSDETYCQTSAADKMSLGRYCYWDIHMSLSVSAAICFR